jgi:hypothetical protein
VNGGTTTLENFIERCGEGEIASDPDVDHLDQYRWGCPMHNAWSDNFQWLPCEVDISTENSR